VDIGGARGSVLTGAEVGASACCFLDDSPVDVLDTRGASDDLTWQVPDPFTGVSFLDLKLRGLLPRTITGPDVTSHRQTLPPVASVAINLRRTTKCCCSSFRRPLFAVAARN